MEFKKKYIIVKKRNLKLLTFYKKKNERFKVLIDERIINTYCI